MHIDIKGKVHIKGNVRNPPDGRCQALALSPTITIILTIAMTIIILIMMMMIIILMMMTMIRTLWTTRQCKDLTWLPTVWLIANHSFHLLLTRCHHYHHHHHHEDLCVKQKDKPILQSSFTDRFPALARVVPLKTWLWRLAIW